MAAELIRTSRPLSWGYRTACAVGSLPAQVPVTLTPGKVTDRPAVRYPQESGRDVRINSAAIPQLNQETLQAQSAQIDTVSGATYTSEGYQQSLQSAIDQAHR